MPYVDYTITKTAADTYRLDYSITDDSDSSSVVQQVDVIKVTKEDADGSRTVYTEYASPSSVARVILSNEQSQAAATAGNASQTGAATAVSGIPVNIDVSNLAVGGVCYEIEPDSGWFQPSPSELIGPGQIH